MPNSGGVAINVCEKYSRHLINIATKKNDIESLWVKIMPPLWESSCCWYSVQVGRNGKQGIFP